MPIPGKFSMTLPILVLLGDGKDHEAHQIVAHLAQHFKLSEAEKNELIPGGAQTKLARTARWAKKELTDAGLAEHVGWGTCRITAHGHQVLNQKPNTIDKALLDQYKATDSLVEADPPDRTPEDDVRAAYNTIRSYLAQEILEMVMRCSSSFFERLVLDVLVGMGYGGSREEASEAVGRASDEGIDGTISEDRLGLEMIYVQAKRWKGNVGRPEIQKFAGALAGRKAGKGVFITTSTFTHDARNYVEKVDARIVLIDGRQLADFMIDYNVGVTTEAVYELKRIDTDYFEDE